MRGLEALKWMNDLEAAKFLKARYEKLRRRARKRGDTVRAERYSRKVEDFGRYLAGLATEFPGQRRRRQPPTTNGQVEDPVAEIVGQGSSRKGKRGGWV